ncbi:MAG TPA: hypothetical protein VJ746_01295 [Nitrospira sp.]|nr:hypothetical protein [Nitrospira sp.]
MRIISISSIAGTALITMLSVGCTTSPDQQRTPCGTDYSCLSNAVFQYRHQADQLNALAQRYEMEADVQAKQAGVETEEVKRSRTLAQQYRTEAREADDLARQYRSQLPHNVVY